VGICRAGSLPCAQVLLEGHAELAAFAAEMIDLGHAPVLLPLHEKLGCDLVYAPDMEREFQSSRR
jgi:hypothetical protein